MEEQEEKRKYKRSLGRRDGKYMMKEIRQRKRERMRVRTQEEEGGGGRTQRETK